jgi:hypothetical protein
MIQANSMMIPDIKGNRDKIRVIMFLQSKTEIKK